MTQWARRLRSILVWTAAREAPRGIVVTLILVYTVAYMSVLMWEVSMRVFGATPPEISAGTAAAYSTLVGAGLAGAWQLFRWGFTRRDSGDDK